MPRQVASTLIDSRDFLAAVPIDPKSTATILAVYDELLLTFGDMDERLQMLLAAVTLSLGCIGIYDRDTLLKNAAEKFMRMHSVH